METQQIAREISAEIIKRQAKVFNEDLPIKFWNIDPWKKKYKLLLIRVFSLCKLYNPEAIHNVIFKDKEGQKVYSLNYPKLEQLIIKHERLLEKKKIVNKIEVKDINTQEQPRKKLGKPTMRSKLD